MLQSRLQLARFRVDRASMLAPRRRCARPASRSPITSSIVATRSAIPSDGFLRVDDAPFAESVAHASIDTPRPFATAFVNWS
jgi:hypothetical protein